MLEDAWTGVKHKSRAPEWPRGVYSTQAAK